MGDRRTPPRRLSTERLARSCAEHPRRILAIWAVLLVGSLAIVSTQLAGVLSTRFTFHNNPEALVASKQMESLGSMDAVTEQVVFTVTDRSLRTPQKLRAMRAVAAAVEALGPQVITKVTSPDSLPQALIARSGNTAVMPVVMAGDINTAYSTITRLLAVTAAADGTAGMDINVTGLASLNEAVNTASERDLQTGEIFGIGLGLIVLLIVFGALVAALIPLILAIAAIIVALALTALVGQFGELSLFVTNMITMMGLAVGIDYALFIVSRFREERAAGVPKLDAIERAGATSGRAVFFSGLTVVVALAGLLVVPLSIFVSLGLGAILVALCAVIAALTLLPALLALLGDNIDRGRMPWSRRPRTSSPTRSFWTKLVERVMARPLVSFLATAALLLAASIPYWGINTGASGITQMPPSTDARIAFETLRSEFSLGDFSPVRIPVLGSAVEQHKEVAKLRAIAQTYPELGPLEIVPSRTATPGVIVQIPMLVDSSSDQAERIIRRLRAATPLPVGGATAFNVEYFDVSDDYLPVVVAIVLTFSFLVLLIAFRSLVVAALAMLLNLLSVGAAFGLLTLVCQNGVGADLLGYQQVHTIEAWLPLFLFAVLFGLSMDYHVFLLSRIRERYLATGDTTGAIAHGISSSARLITGAALIMVAVFAGFSAGSLVMFQQMGFGLGVAVLLDATLVRGILVPAAMRLLGKWNWYLPKWLAWLPEISIEGPSTGKREGTPPPSRR